MRCFRAAILALSTYTRLPMPRVQWDGEAAGLALGFLPLAGGAVGLAVLLWQLVCRGLGLSAVMFAAVCTALPVLVSGGIHIDGFCDTSDALASRQSRERRLEILKDPHVGAFALIRLCVYLLICFAVLHELFLLELDRGLGLVFVLSRCLASVSALTLPGARKNGMLAAFTGGADLRRTGVIIALFAAAALAGWLWLTLPQGAFGLALCLPVALWYRSMALKSFGGVTGDTTGFFLQLIELALPLGTLIGGLLWRNFC